MLKVYIAAAYPGLEDTPERARVIRWRDHVRASKRLELTWDWLPVIDEKRAAGIAEGAVSSELRRTHALADLNGIARANVVWLLAPSTGGRGCFFEFGAAWTFALLERHFGLMNTTVHQAVYPEDRRITEIFCEGLNARKRLLVSGPDYTNTIFTELADGKFASDENAFAWLLGAARTEDARK